MTNNCGIYKIKNVVNNKVYIGQSRNLKKRLNEHFNNLKNNRHNNLHMQSSYNKYGLESFETEIVEYCKETELTKKELYWINYYNSHDKVVGYNIDIPNLEDESFYLSQETKDKISKANIKFSESELISYLQEFYYIEGRVPTQRELTNSNYPSSTVYFERFGSFKQALIEADLYSEVSNSKLFERKEYTKEEVYNKFKVFVDKYNRFPNHIEQKETSKLDLPSTNVVMKHYRSIEELKDELGLSKEYLKKTENEKSIIALKELFEIEGKVTARSIDKSSITRSGKFYRNRFGSIAEACKFANIPYGV